jgi:hypothetical protein
MSDDIIQRMEVDGSSADKPIIIGASIGNCVHIAGVANFLRIADSMGIKTLLLGAAISLSHLIEVIDKIQPGFVAISYRLTPEVGEKLLNDFFDLLGERKPKLLFGGTPKMAKIAIKTGRFDYVFIGDEPFSQIQKILRMIQEGKSEGLSDSNLIKIKPHDTIVGRLESLFRIKEDGHFMPLLRHHFGLPSLEDTIDGIKKIADSKILDIISIAPDQNAQQFFFNPELMDPKLNGAGGVPIRNKKDLRKMKISADRGNFPLLRIYSGTQNLKKWAELSKKELNNAWGAIPLFWYSELDGRSKRELESAISENQSVIKWYAKNYLPVELLEAHQWSLRDAPDAVSVAAAYIGAYNAKSLGIKNFIGQYMFNTPRFTSLLSDIGKMTAQYMMIESLCSKSFVQWRQVRPGLAHFSIDPDIAKGQLAATISFALSLRPHIIHVVSYTEADHAADAQEVIQSCKIVWGALKNTFLETPDPLLDERISMIRRDIIEDASWILGTIINLGKQTGAEDPLTDPKTLATAVKIGILDAPHLRGQPCGLGLVETGPVKGGWRVINKFNGQQIPEPDRLMNILKKSDIQKMLGCKTSHLIGKLNF